VHLIGFIIRIYHDARSPERQINELVYVELVGFLERMIFNTRQCGLMKLHRQSQFPLNRWL